MCGGIIYSAKSELVIIDGNLKGERYRDEIIMPHVLPIAGAIDPDRFILVVYNARSHRT